MIEHVAQPKRYHSNTTRVKKDFSNPKPGHTTGGSSRGARRSGQAGSGKIKCQRNYSPVYHRFITGNVIGVPSARFETRRVRACRRVGCTSQDVPVARRKRRWSARRQKRRKRAGARTVCASKRGASASVRAEYARRSARSTRVCARIAGRRIRPFFSVGLSWSGAVVWVRWSGPVPRVAASQPLAPGGARRPPLH